MNKVATWSEALNYPGFDDTLNRIAFVERELAEIKDRMRQFEAKALSGKRDFQPIQEAFNRWEEQSDLDLTSIKQSPALEQDSGLTDTEC